MVAQSVDEPVGVCGRAGLRTGSGFVVNARALRHEPSRDRGRRCDRGDPARTFPPRRAPSADGATDIALLGLLDPPPGLQALELGSSEQLRAGDWIASMATVRLRRQSRPGGQLRRPAPHNDLRVTTTSCRSVAPVNPGSSGCPVVNLYGEVIGVMTRWKSTQGISFAVPAARRSGRSRRWNGNRTAARLPGIEFASHTCVDEGNGEGADRLGRGRACTRALRRGDVVLAVDGQRITDARTCTSIVRDPGRVLPSSCCATAVCTIRSWQARRGRRPRPSPLRTEWAN